MKRWPLALTAASCLVGLTLALAACDPDGKKSCAWVLEPEPSLQGKTDPGYIPVCARNRTTMKEDCRLQATLEYAKKVYGRKFRYVDLRVESPGLPRTISKIEFCDGKG
jgi:hypothetical protein